MRHDISNRLKTSPQRFTRWIIIVYGTSASTLIVIFSYASFVAIAATPSISSVSATLYRTEVALPQNAAWWLDRHQSILTNTARYQARLLFLGDSLTAHWLDEGEGAWNQYYQPRGAVNLAIGGDKIQNLLWRVQNGELNGMNPKVTIVLIGTNNLLTSTQREIIAGIQTVVRVIHRELPNTNILLLGIFPRYDQKISLLGKTRLVNRALSSVLSESYLTFLDVAAIANIGYSPQPADLTSDLLHVNEGGYRTWALTMENTLEKLLNEAPRADSSGIP